MKLYSLSKETVLTIERNLQKLIRKTQVRCTFLFERSGYIISAKGDFQYLQPEDMGAMAAGALAAIQSMVSLTNSNEQTITFHNNNLDKIHFAMVTPWVFLAVFYDAKTTSKKVREAVKEFVKAVQQCIIKDQTHPVIFDSVQFINEKLNELFKEAVR